jgi:hypothetical protein
MAQVDLPTRDSFPGNSNKEKRNKVERSKEQDKKDEKNIEQVAKAKRQKKSVGKKFTEAFIGDDSDADNIFDYILYDVLVPAAKNTIFDAITGGFSMALFGEQRNSTRTSRNRGQSYVSYGNYYRDDSGRYVDNRSSSPRNRSIEARPIREKLYNDDIIVDSRGEGEEVLDRLLDIIDTYGSASLADLYSLVGIDAAYTDNNYGWYNLSNATITRVRNGFAINLPRAVDLEN